VPVAVAIYSEVPTILDEQTSAQLAAATATSRTRASAEVQEALHDALSIAGLDDLLRDAVEARRQVLVAERQRMPRHAVEQPRGGHAPSAPAAWLAGIVDLAPGRHDLLAVTVLYPA
jgi:hypothetical protein